MRAPIVLLLSFVCAAAACGGSVGGTPSSSSSPPADPAKTGDGTTKPTLVAACPATPPADASACSTIVTCEYGDDFDVDCNTLAICDVSHTWHVQGQSCKDPHPGLGSGCPSAFASASGACTAVGRICDFPEGRCGCIDPPTFGPDSPDASAPPPAWSCQAPLAAGCPALRPRNGEPCATPVSYCAYGAPCVEGSVHMSCSEGYWTGDLALPCGGG